MNTRGDVCRHVTVLDNIRMRRKHNKLILLKIGYDRITDTWYVIERDNMGHAMSWYRVALNI